MVPMLSCIFPCRCMKTSISSVKAWNNILTILNEYVGDMCVAMNDWVQNPTAHMALDDILPCLDNATAQATLSKSKKVTYQLVELVNKVITVSNVNMPPSAPQPFYHNQSGRPVPVLCNPFNTNRTCSWWSGSWKCNTGSVAASLVVDQRLEVWQNYACEVSSNNICTTVGSSTPTMHSKMINNTNVSSGLNHYGPFLVRRVTWLQFCARNIYQHKPGSLSLFEAIQYVGLHWLGHGCRRSHAFFDLLGNLC